MDAVRRGCRQISSAADRGAQEGLFNSSAMLAALMRGLKQLQQMHVAPSVKQQLDAVRMLFDGLITRQVVPMRVAAEPRRLALGQTEPLHTRTASARFRFVPLFVVGGCRLASRQGTDSRPDSYHQLVCRSMRRHGPTASRITAPWR